MKAPKRTPLAERFWRHVRVDPSGCWLWTGGLREGYGSIGSGGGNGRGQGGHSLLAHRVAYQMMVGNIPPGLFVCHSCDVRNCVNPGHLWLGTNKDNIRDALSKGRMAIGDRNGLRLHPERRVVLRGSALPQAKLTEAQVLEIRTRYAHGRGNQQALAAEYGVDPSLVSRIVRCELWRHVAVPEVAA
jgi:hypothetical protein